MADYWKSQPRKFCDFCKCWIADNKPSRDFHEKGKKHQENVKRKLNELCKKGRADAEKEKEDERAMQQMEQRALAALKKDIMDNPSLAAQYGIKLKSKDEAKSKDSATTSKAKDSNAAKKEKEEVDENVPENWEEAQSPEGYTYYWNTVTQESRWVKPEGYLSPEERLKSSTEETTKDTPSEMSTKKAKTNQTKSSSDSEKAEPTASEESSSDDSDKEETKSDNVKEKTKSESPKETPQEGSTTHSAYGQWQTVQTEPEEAVDLQLPVSKHKEDTTAVVMVSEPKIKFREKKVSSLGGSGLFSQGPTAFKKRKLNPGASMRKRDDS